MFLFRVLAVVGQLTGPDRLDGSTAGIPALVVLGLPVLALGVLVTLYWRTRTEIRRRELDPPLYLLTLISATSTGEPAPLSRDPDQEDLELDRGRRREITMLRRRGKQLLVALGANAIVVWLATAWYVEDIRTTRSPESGRSFTSVERLPVVQPETLTSDLALNTTRTEPDAREPDPVVERAKPAAPAVRQQEPPGPVSPPDSRTSPSRTGRSSPADSSPAPRTARIDTAVTATVVRADVPAPTPEPVRAAPVLPPAPDPATARADAERALDIAGRHVVRELNAHRPVAAAGSGDAAMGKLAEWLRNQRPSVSSGALVDVVVEGPSGEAILPVTLRWRDDFGVGKQRSLRLRIAVQREADDWVFSGAELLERFP